MKIAAIGAAIPSRRVSNDDVLRMLSEHRPYDSMARSIERSALSLMVAAGSHERYYRDRERGERADELLGAAMRDALSSAGLEPAQVDLLLYCGVGRGFIEPSNAHICAAQLGAHCDCFDISDACMGWLRAAQVAYDGMQAGRYEHVLVVNAEFGMYEMFEDCWRPKSPLDLRRTFAAYTLGEAATATVLSRSDEPWTFVYRTRPELSDLCFYPLPGHEGYVSSKSRAGRSRSMSFSSYSAELFAAAERELETLIAETIDDPDAPDLYVPHAASSTAAIATAQRIGLDVDRLYADIMPRYGNVASASLPLGLRCALEESRLRAGHDVVLCPASAGVTVAVARFSWES